MIRVDLIFTPPEEYFILKVKKLIVSIQMNGLPFCKSVQLILIKSMI